jgi:ribosome assembly protein SQT1
LICWDLRSPTPVFKLTPADARFKLGGVTSLGINTSSSIAVIGGADGGVRIISLSKRKVVAELGGHTEGESVEAVAFLNLPGSGVVATGATDGKVCIWDLSTMRIRATLEHKVWTYSLCVY